MSLFILGSAGLLGLTLWLVLPPLLRAPPPAASPEAGALNLDVLRDQQRELEADLRSGALHEASYEAARDDLARRVVQDAAAPSALDAVLASARQPWTAAAMALFIGASAAALYQAVGTPQALREVEAATPAASAPFASADGGAAPAMTVEQIEAMVQRLAARLQARPADPDGWRMLIRSYETLRRFDQAAAAYGQLLQHTPETPELLADYAVTLGMSQGQTLAGAPERLIHRALALDPDNIQALALAGSAAFERHDYANAVKPWQRLLAQVPQESEMAQSIARSIDKARALQAGQPRYP